MTKDKLQRILEAANFKMVSRVNINGMELFVADGFMPPERLKYLDKFGVHSTAEEHPFGAWATICYPEAKNGLVSCGVSDAFHGLGKSQEAKLQLRIAAVLELTRQKLEADRKHMH